MITCLLQRDPARAVEALRQAVAACERLEMRPFQARGMIDLGRATTRTGVDAREVLERARAILLARDAKLFLEVDEALAETNP